MTNLNDIELHDALLNGMNIDYIAKTLDINVYFYKNSNVKNREHAIFRFEQVESVSQICSFNDLKKNAFAGNINYWELSEGHGTTYIYLINGCIAITAASVHRAA